MLKIMRMIMRKIMRLTNDCATDARESAASRLRNASIVCKGSPSSSPDSCAATSPAILWSICCSCSPWIRCWAATFSTARRTLYRGSSRSPPGRRDKGILLPDIVSKNKNKKKCIKIYLSVSALMNQALGVAIHCALGNEPHYHCLNKKMSRYLKMKLSTK